MDNLRFLLIFIILIADYFVLKKYKSIALNVSTVLYTLIIILYYLFTSPFWEYTLIIMFAYILGLNCYYVNDFRKAKEYNKSIYFSGFLGGVLLLFFLLGKL